MNTSILALLQITAALLTGIQNNSRVPSSTAQQVVTMASQVVQMSTQATAVIPFSVPQDNSIYPGYDDLLHSPYLDVSGKYVQLGSTVQLEGQYLSFGDLNGDGVDDAGVVVMRTAADGTATYALAAMLNQGGILFNIADYLLGNTLPIINSHNIVSGELIMNMQTGDAPAVTSTYQLLGNQFLKVD
ncbi:MAG TPA: hypothetical protein VMR99_01405 [Candidatus Paceibacterota bacterium]|nr:hypothetical protein [Candidatus Paceibacterota bacterium]